MNSFISVWLMEKLRKKLFSKLSRRENDCLLLGKMMVLNQEMSFNVRKGWSFESYTIFLSLQVIFWEETENSWMKNSWNWFVVYIPSRFRVLWKYSLRTKNLSSRENPPECWIVIFQLNYYVIEGSLGKNENHTQY